MEKLIIASIFNSMNISPILLYKEKWKKCTAFGISPLNKSLLLYTVFMYFLERDFLVHLTSDWVQVRIIWWTVV